MGFGFPFERGVWVGERRICLAYSAHVRMEIDWTDVICCACCVGLL